MLKISSQLNLPFDAATQVLAFLGMRGSGKTYGASKLCELMLAAKMQCVILDPVGVWWGVRQASDGKSNGFPIPVLGGLHGDVPIDSQAGSLIADLIVDKDLSAVLDVSQFINAEQIRFVTDFLSQFFQRKKAAPSAVHLFIDECQEFCPQNPQKDETKMLHQFQRVIKLGRNFGIGASLLSQRPQEINKKVLNMSECVFAFQMTGPQEREAIAKWTKEKGVDEDIYSMLPHLENGSPRVWSPQWLKISKTIRIAEKTTYDSSSTPKVGAKRIEVKQLSPVDIEKITEAMKSVVEKAKAEDPKALKQKILALERELAQLRTHECSKAANCPAISEQAESRLARMTTEYKQAAERILEEAKRQIVSLDESIDKARTLVFYKTEELWGELRKFSEMEMPDTERKTTGAPVNLAYLDKQLVPGNVRKVSGISPSLNKPLQAILDAIAWFEAVGIQSPNRSNVAAIAGVSHRSSGYRNNVSALSTKGLIHYPQDGCLALTKEGKGTANLTDRPTSLIELHGAWIRSKTLSRPQRDMLIYLLKVYPTPITRQELAERTGVLPLSSGFRNNVSALSSLQLIIYPASNMVKANAALLFPDGLR